jgi:nucleoside-diphosphate-sugar epimerase
VTSIKELNITVLLTGATGFIGRHLTKKLIDEGHEVHALVRDVQKVPLQLKGARLHEVDGSTASIDTAVAASRAEVAVHLATFYLAEHTPEQIEPLCVANITFGAHFLNALVRAKVPRVICTGTSWQTLGPNQTPVNLYAATKEAFESILRFYADAYPLRALVLKLYDTYGLDDPRKKLLFALRQSLGSRMPLQLSPGDQYVDFLNVRDIVAGICHAIELSKDGRGFSEFYLRSGHSLTLKELVAHCEHAAGRAIPVAWGARPYRAREVMKVDPVGTVLPGWSPKVSLDDGLREFFAEKSHV